MGAKEVLQEMYAPLMNYINELDKLEYKRNGQRSRGKDGEKWIGLLTAFAFLSAYLIFMLINFHPVSDAGMLIIFGFAIFGLPAPQDAPVEAPPGPKSKRYGFVSTPDFHNYAFLGNGAVVKLCKKGYWVVSARFPAANSFNFSLLTLG
jgi:hypothetical protein